METSNKPERTREANKIKNNNLERVILRLKEEGMNIRQITEEILRETGVDISQGSITAFLKRDENLKKDLIRSDKELQKTARELAINYKSEIVNILTEIREVKDKALREQDVQAFDRMVGRLFQGLELINRIVDGGGIKNQKVDVKVLYQNIFTESDAKYQKMKKDILGFDTDINSIVLNSDKNEERKIKKRDSKIIDVEYRDVREMQRENANK